MEPEIVRLRSNERARGMDIMIVQCGDEGGWDVLDMDEKQDVIWAIGKGVQDLERAIEIAAERARKRKLKYVYVEPGPRNAD